MKRGTLAKDLMASVLQCSGVFVFAVGAYQVYRPLGYLLAGLFLMLVGFSLTPKPEKAAERGPEYR
jgi:hypothetical protein